MEWQAETVASKPATYQLFTPSMHRAERGLNECMFLSSKNTWLSKNHNLLSSFLLIYGCGVKQKHSIFQQMASVIRKLNLRKWGWKNIATIPPSLVCVDLVKYRLIKLEAANINHTSKNTITINNPGTVWVSSSTKRRFPFHSPVFFFFFVVFFYWVSISLPLWGSIKLSRSKLSINQTAAGVHDTETQLVLKVDISAAVILLVKLSPNGSKKLEAFLKVENKIT